MVSYMYNTNVISSHVNPVDSKSWLEDKSRARGAIPDSAFSPGKIRFYRETDANIKIQQDENMDEEDWSPFR